MTASLTVGAMMPTSKSWFTIARSWFTPVDIEASLHDLGIEIEKVDSDELYARCPGHLSRLGKEDSHASWSVNSETGDHHCFSCGFGGSFVYLVHEVTGKDLNESAAWCKSRAGGIERARQILDGPVKAPEKAVDTSKQVNEASLALFTPPPFTALNSRLLTEDACRNYGVRWNPERGSWILPVRDPATNKLLGWQEKSERYFNNYPPHVPISTTLFGLENYLRQHRRKRIILVESPLDAVRLTSVGIDGGLASFGASVSPAQVELIISSTSTLLVAMDNDDAGRKSARNLRQKLAGRMTLRFLNYEGIEVKDIGEMSANEIHHAVGTAYSSVLARF